MVKASWGIKRTCQSCAARFYDLNKSPIKCPKCGREHDREDFVKVRRGRAAAAAAAATSAAAAAAAAKAALNAVTQSFAHTFGPKVRVNCIMPGTFLTDISKAWDMERFKQRAQAFAMKRGGESDEIVGAALYFASDASSYTTGSILLVDGGQPL